MKEKFKELLREEDVRYIYHLAYDEDKLATIRFATKDRRLGGTLIFDPREEKGSLALLYAMSFKTLVAVEPFLAFLFRSPNSIKWSDVSDEFYKLLKEHALEELSLGLLSIEKAQILYKEGENFVDVYVLFKSRKLRSPDDFVAFVYTALITYNFALNAVPTALLTVHQNDISDILNLVWGSK